MTAIRLLVRVAELERELSEARRLDPAEAERRREMLIKQLKRSGVLQALRNPGGAP